MRRNKFSLSHQKVLSCDMGELVPMGVMEVLPGDSVQHSTSALVRCSPLLSPVMHPVHIKIHHWFVPYRLIWTDWENFITGGPDGADASVFPTVSSGGSGFALGSLADYLGVCPSVPNQYVSALPFRAYALIFNEWYRDQDLVSPLALSLASGVDSTTNTALQNVAWEKDYFTTARPWEQKGPSITIPLGTSAPVKGIGVTGTNGAASGATFRETAPLPNRTYANIGGNFGGASNAVGVELDTTGGSSKPKVFADLTGVSAVTVNVLREALALQRFSEARARFGSRYVEYLAYLGVQSSDARLQRPEYLGGGKQTIQFSEVLQTAEGTDPVGDLKGHGIGALRSNRYRRFFEEHGLVLSFISVKPKTMYVQGLPRLWNKRSREDFWQKELEHIGQQEILNKEVYMAHTTPDGVFGFQDRYDEYRRMESSIAGEFRTILDFWHLGRTFSSSPALNSSFVTAVPSERVFAVPSQDVLWIMASHSIQARRLVAQTGSSFIF